MKLTIVLLTFPFGISSCAVAPDFQDTCSFQYGVRLSTFGYIALVVEAGLPAGAIAVEPRITLYSPSIDAPTRQIDLALVPGEQLDSVDLHRDSCQRIDWHYFTVKYDESEWLDFWSQTDSERFNIGFAFSDKPETAPASSFGLSILDRDSGTVIVSCGCYAL
jgi:hypothetical protein